jgi:hypothetical protein
VRGREFLNVLIIDAGAAIDRQRANYSTDRRGIESHGLEGFPDLLRIEGRPVTSAKRRESSSTDAVVPPGMRYNCSDFTSGR